MGDTSVANQITANRIFANSGQAIDLGNDGVTYNSSSPRQGPNNLQNFPIIVSTADSRLQGWLGGSTPDTTFRVDVYAGAGYGTGGSGEAQDYLGSLQVTTDSQGQAVFDVPFTPPAELPMITATATDPNGNTSEVSALRRASLQAPTQQVREVLPGQPLIFSAASGDGVALQDPDSGPLEPLWDLTLSVAAGTLTLSGTAGLTGSGDGTGTLDYRGSLSALNAALEGLSYTPSPGFDGDIVLLDGESDGARAVQSLVVIIDTLGVFLVTTTADSGPGSLRQAILDSNDVIGGTNTIDFAIPGSGVQTIAPASPLPAITQAVLIDGFSQPGYGGTPLIELSGGQAGGGNGLTITGSDVTVRGLDIGGFSWDAGILISGTTATGNVIQANDIGTDPSGSVAVPNQYGVQILGGASRQPRGRCNRCRRQPDRLQHRAGRRRRRRHLDRQPDHRQSDLRQRQPTSASASNSTARATSSCPINLVRGFEQEETIEAWFKTTSGGVILGYQGSPTDSPGQPAGWVPALYVGTDGKLYGDIWQLNQVVSNAAVNDGRWHSVALVVDGSSRR